MVVSAMMRFALILLMLAIAAPAAAEISVYSPQPEAVSVTIYRDGFALITETRTVELPADAVTLVFQGVVDLILPQSAVVVGQDRALAETNFTYDPLTPQSLVERSVGKQVTLVRTNRRTGKVTRTPVTVKSAAESHVVFESLDGHEALQCSGLPERLEFSEIPGELTPKPVLSIRLAAGPPGKRTVRLSYLTHGFAWTANYVGRLNERGDRMALTGWATLTNKSNVSFKGAQVLLVAGKLNLLDESEGGTAVYDPSANEEQDELPDSGSYIKHAESVLAAQRLVLLPDCFSSPLPPPPRANEGDRMFRREVAYDVASPMTMLEPITVTGNKLVRESFADYQLYRLPWATDLDARQTKQAVFLEKPRVKVERFYGVRLGDIESTPGNPAPPPDLMLRWENKTASGLGEPLPQGRVRIFEPYGGTAVFAGEADIPDKAVGLPVELALARALNVGLEFEQEHDKDETEDSDVFTVTNAYHFWNDKDVPILIEVRHRVDSYWGRPRVIRSNISAGRKYGDFAWRFTLEPGRDRLLRYTLQADVPD
ncbi:MAG TPA: hypothetical protein VFS52_06400 [Steroidobacteraceae bacterium]|nr:hypothetical protein [Steroidobacteraceae bacterium]